MTRKPVPAPVPAHDPRPMPPRPASGGAWVFDPEAWAFVRPAPPEAPPTARVEPGVEAGIEPAASQPKETGK